MNAIRIRTRLDSETPHLPQLKHLVGRTVEIIVLEEEVATPPSDVHPGTGDWDAAEKAIRELEDYDFDAQRDQDECDRKHATEHLP